jgi:hypothetical protein
LSCSVVLPRLRCCLLRVHRVVHRRSTMDVAGEA